MHCKHICQHHAMKLQYCENSALEAWSRMMQEGTRAYVAGDAHTAIMYLGSALEIALLRLGCESNAIFHSIHITSPLGFLIESLILTRQYQRAIHEISLVSSRLGENQNTQHQMVLCVLQKHYERICMEEKRGGEVIPFPSVKSAFKSADCSVH